MSDGACSTGGFLLAAHDYVVKHDPHMTKDQRKQLAAESFKGWELVQATARLCAMNMLLHGIGSVEAASRRLDENNQRQDAAATVQNQSFEESESG